MERGGSSSGSMGGEEGKGWYWHNNQKKLLKMEVTEALEMRKWVVIALLGVLGIGFGFGVLALKRIWDMGRNGGWLG